MDLVIFVIGFLGLIVALAMLIVYAVKKKPKKIPSIVLGISLVLMITGLFMGPFDTDQDLEEPSTKVSPDAVDPGPEYEELTLEEVTVLKKHYKDFTVNDIEIFERIIEKGENLSPKEFNFYYENLVRIDKEIKEFQNESQPESEPEPRIYGLGEEIIIFIDGKETYSITFNRVTETNDRNQFSDKEPEQVIIIDYTYKNIASEDDLFISGINFKVIDAEGTIADTYPAPVSKRSQRIPMGTNCNAQEAFGLDNKSDSIKLLFYDNTFSNRADATFELDIN